MPIDANEVRRIAGLAQLSLDDPTVEAFRHQLEAILDYVALLDSVDAGSVAPTATALEGAPALRPDEPRPGLGARDALTNAPDSAEGHFRVPRVLEE